MVAIVAGGFLAHCRPNGLRSALPVATAGAATTVSMDIEGNKALFDLLVSYLSSQVSDVD